MKDQLGTFDLTIWATLIVAQSILLGAAIGKRLYRRLPGFSVYVLISFLDSLLLFAIAFLASYNTYYHVFYIAGHAVSALAFVTLIEFGWQVLPGLDLPRRHEALGFLCLAIAAILLFVWLWPIRSLANEKRIEVGAYLVIAAAFAFIAGYSRYIGLRWSRLVGGIAITMGIIYSIDGVMKALIGHYSFAIAVHIRQARQVVNVLSILVWIVVILSSWGEAPMSEEDLSHAERVVAGTAASLRSLALEDSNQA